MGATASVMPIASLSLSMSRMNERATLIGFTGKRRGWLVKE